MAEPNFLYKIMVLALLETADQSLSTSQITDFFTDYRYTDYFTVQSVIHDLMDTGMIAEKPTETITYYQLTSEGKRTLNAFRDKISFEIAKDINSYLNNNSVEIRQENSLMADYDKATDGGYLVHLVARSGAGGDMINITIRVPSREHAEAMCMNWKIRSEEVYGEIMDVLVQ